VPTNPQIARQPPPAPPVFEHAHSEVRDLIKQYPATTAVAGVSFAVPEGICFGLLGPNGAGKTTTIEIMEGILPPSAGAVLYRGAPLGKRFQEEAGILFQKTALQDFLTVRQCIALFRGLYEKGLDVEEVIRVCALEKLADRDSRKLSGGQQQRLLAIALVNDPAVLFLDEPTTGLDPQARRNFWDRCSRSRHAARPSSSPPTTWRRRSCCVMRLRSWTRGAWLPRDPRAGCCTSTSPKSCSSCRATSCRRPHAN
jgi:ABC-type Na+ transport system ATPase subunit NatA